MINHIIMINKININYLLFIFSINQLYYVTSIYKKLFIQAFVAHPHLILYWIGKKFRSRGLNLWFNYWYEDVQILF